MQTIKDVTTKAALRLIRVALVVAVFAVIYRLLPLPIRALVVALVPFAIGWLAWRYYSAEPDDNRRQPPWWALLFTAMLLVWSLRVIGLGYIAQLDANPWPVVLFSVVIAAVALYCAWLWIEDAAIVRAAIHTWHQHKSGPQSIWSQTADHGSVIRQAQLGSYNDQLTGSALADSQDAYRQRLQAEAAEQEAAARRTELFLDNLRRNDEEE